MRWSGQKGVSKTLGSYVRELKFSNKKHLLVEGRSDKLLFNRLLNEAIGKKQNTSKLTDYIFIDDAESIENDDNLQFQDKLGNCEKIEIICQKIQNSSFAEKLVGFVDRDFREFTVTDILQDNLNKHQVIGRLIWSRGHSLENYFFESFILCNALISLSNIDWIDSVIRSFEKLIDPTIRIACAISLAAKEIELIGKIQPSIHWKIIDIDFQSTKVKLKTQQWQSFLVDNHNIAKDKVETFIEKYNYWNLITKKANFNVIRWLCHGHIGMRTILAVYLSCVEQIGKNEATVNISRKISNRYNNDQELQSMIDEKRREIANKTVKSLQQKIHEQDITHTCSCWWVNTLLNNENLIYPQEIFSLLDIKLF